MARTSITTARYNPFTMEELYSPVLRATEQHLQQQEKYDELANQALMWKYRIPNDPNSTAYKMYDEFSKNLETMTNDLQTNGILNPSARDNFSNLRKTNPIPVLEDAWNRREADRQMREKLGEDAVWETQMGSLDNYITGTTNNNYVSRQNVYNAGANAAKSIAKSITDNPEYKKILGNQYFQKIEREGIPANVLRAAQFDDISYLNKDASGQTDSREFDLYDMLRTSYDNDATAFGFSNWNNQGAKDRLENSYWSGMQQGLQSTKYNEIANRDHETRGERITNSINQFRLDEMNREKGVMDRLAARQGTDADKWYARTHGIDPETGAKVSSGASSGAGKTTSRVMRYIPQTISLDSKGNVTGRGDKSINETMSSDKTYHTVPFKELSKGQQTQVLTQMGYTKEEINAMYKETPVQPIGFRNPVNTNVTTSEFIGNTELDPEVLSSSLTIYVKDNTKKPGKESDAGLIIKPNNYQTSANFFNNYINENLLGNLLYELGETSNPTIETDGYDEDVQSSVDADLQ